MKYIITAIILTLLCSINLLPSAKAQTLTYTEYGCTVRPDPNNHDTWIILNDANHDPIGCDHVNQT